MAGVRPSAREIAETMARSFLSALALAVEPGQRVPEPFVAMMLPAGEIVAGIQRQVDEMEARLNAYAGALAARMLRDAEERGELDDGLWPDVVLTPEMVRDLERQYMPGGDA